MANRLPTQLVLLGLISGCGSPLELGVANEATRMQNTRMQNTRMQNTRMQNGVAQNGAPLALVGVITSTMQRLLVQPAAGKDPDLSNSNLVLVPNVKLTASAFTDGNPTHGPAWFQGTLIKAALWNGATNTVVIGAIYIDAVSTSPYHSDVAYYTLRATHPFVPAPGDTCGSTGCQWIWEPACGSAAAPATALGGWWDYRIGVQGGGAKLYEQGHPRYDTYITFGCIDGAIGKCVDKLGYRPWQKAALECAGILFSDYHCQQPTQELLHEACVRMVRADYCGDGQDHTIDGMDLDIWDQSGLNGQLPFTASTNSGGVPFGHEAEWTPNGARCLSNLLMPRISHPGAGETVSQYLLSDPAHSYCAGKWNSQLNQQYKAGYTATNNQNFRWDDGDCFGIEQSQGWNLDAPGRPVPRTVSLHSTFDFANVWPNMNMHDRVLLKDKALCIDDSANMASSANYNGYKYSWPWCAACLADGSPRVGCSPPNDI